MNKQPKGLLFDMVLCAGCRRCVVACKEKQGFDVPEDTEEIRKLSATAYTCMWEEDDYPVRDLCRHCVDPTCASVCPVSALRKTELGPVIYDASRCMGCRYCMLACPFSIPRYEWSKPIPAVRKCDMCYDRQLAGGTPACAEACPDEATVFGKREELIELARKRIASDPDEYAPHIYGEKELGGTSVLFLVPHEIASLGYKAGMPAEALPTLTWNVLSKLPGIAVGAGASLFAFWWITRRRDEVAEAEARYGSHLRGPRTLPHGKDEGNGRS